MTLTTILPALDEAASIAGVVEGLIDLVDEVIVVDNGSNDGTGAIARAAGATVVTEPRRGFGAACYAGVLAAGGDVISFLDADGSYVPDDVLRISAPVLAGELDLCLGTRMRTPDAVIAGWVRIANRTLGLGVRLAGGPFLSDIGPLRAIRRTTLIELGVRDRAQAWPLEMVILAARANLRIGELPVRYLQRTGGASKVTGSFRGTLRATTQMGRMLASEALR